MIPFHYNWKSLYVRHSGLWLILRSAIHELLEMIRNSIFIHLIFRYGQKFLCYYLCTFLKYFLFQMPLLSSQGIPKYASCQLATWGSPKFAATSTYFKRQKFLPEKINKDLNKTQRAVSVFSRASSSNSVLFWLIKIYRKHLESNKALYERSLLDHKIKFQKLETGTHL